jgi:hypothetical protein
VRTRSTQATGAAAPSGASSAQTATGSGLKAGPSRVSRLASATSRPHRSHIHGSYDGAGATSASERAASAAATATARHTEREAAGDATPGPEAARRAEARGRAWREPAPITG